VRACSWWQPYLILIISFITEINYRLYLIPLELINLTNLENKSLGFRTDFALQQEAQVAFSTRKQDLSLHHTLLFLW
jgi:hypothetical protein